MPQLPVYMDNHATTPVDPRVVEAMLPWFTEKFGNAASVNHAFGWEAADAVQQARDQVARLLGSQPESVVFTSGATEANNLALKGVMQAAGPTGHLLTNAAEHRAVLDPVKKLERRGYEATILPVDSDARVDPAAVASALRPDTRLVSVMLANNEVGSLNLIAEIGRLCRENQVLFLVDAVQAIGRIPVDAAELGADLLSLTAHKVYGPKGVGALWIRRDGNHIPIESQIDGGGHERRLRSGTLAVPSIVGFGAACEIAGDSLAEESRRIGDLRDRLWDGLCGKCDGLHLNGHTQQRLPGNLNVSFEGVDGDALMMGLKDLAVSSGSACTAADPEPSHVLRAMGRSDPLTRASLRFGLGRFNTADEVEFAISYVADVVMRLRQDANAGA